MSTTGILLNPEMLAKRLSVSKSWVHKNFKALPHILLPNTDGGKRKLLRFDWNEIIEFLKGGNEDCD